KSGRGFIWDKASGGQAGVVRKEKRPVVRTGRRPSSGRERAGRPDGKAPVVPKGKRPRSGRECASSGRRVLFTPDDECVSPRTTTAFPPGRRLPFPPDDDCPSLRTTTALPSGRRLPFPPDDDCPSLRTTAALRSGRRLPFPPDDEPLQPVQQLRLPDVDRAP